MNNYIEIDSPEDIDTAIQLALDSALRDEYCCYWGGIIMPLPKERQFTDVISVRNLKTRLMEDHEVTITHAYCGLIIEVSESGKIAEILCHALNKNEGFYSTNPDSLWPGMFHPVTKDIEVVKTALKRFFGTTDFENNGSSDPVGRCVIPFQVPDKKE